MFFLVSVIKLQMKQEKCKFYGLLMKSPRLMKMIFSQRRHIILMLWVVILQDFKFLGSK